MKNFVTLITPLGTVAITADFIAERAAWAEWAASHRTHRRFDWKGEAERLREMLK